MALQKSIELGNGVTVSYHRVVSVNNITNQSSIIEIASYTSAAKREEEKTATNGGEINVFINSMYINTDYNKNLNVDNAYQYIKTLPTFELSEDV